ncbi:MAG: ABC transporter ATP-binding protein [Candidatus Acidiferrales bacterium]
MIASVISSQKLSKRYAIGTREPYVALRDVLANTFSMPTRLLRSGKNGAAAQPDHIWALRDVSFEIHEGEAVGIIGRNGAGKTTLLKILSRITRPTSGSAELRGRVGSLLEVGTGFHPELTGRENVFLSGGILGMKKREIAGKFDEIVAFAEVADFIDTPLKRYSTGMQMRLAFAVAAHLDPEILLVDEVLAVGDLRFQKKCMGKMGDIARAGRTLLFVSHNMRAVTDLCPRCLWIQHGHLIGDGTSTQVVTHYLNAEKSGDFDGTITENMHKNASGDVYFRRASLLDAEGREARNFFFGQPLRVALEYEVCRPVEAMRLAVAIEKMDGTIVCVLHNTDDSEQKLIDAVPGTYKATLDVDLPLMPGAYSIHLTAKPAPGYWGAGKSWDWVERVFDFFVEEFSQQGQGILPCGGAVRPNSKWRIQQMEMCEVERSY